MEEVSRVVLRARGASIPVQESVLKDRSRQGSPTISKETPDFFIRWIEKEVKNATPRQRKEWRKTGKTYLKTYATTARMLPLSLLTMAAAPTLPGFMPGQSIINILTLPLVWLMEAVMPKAALPPISAPQTHTPALNPPMTPQQAAIQVPQSASVPHMMQQSPVSPPPPPVPSHLVGGAESLIPTPVIPTAGSGPDLTELAQMLLAFVEVNGFYLLLALFAATGILKAAGRDTLALKVATNAIKGMGILLLAVPAITLMLYIIIWILGPFPGFHAPTPVIRR